MLNAVADDVVMRGDVPCIVLGDLNVVMEETPPLQRLMDQGIWKDARPLGTPEMQARHTCWKGSGSIIDYILLNRNAL
eukprot:3181573-Alexandrium_andersonii.AAC.1